MPTTATESTFKEATLQRLEALGYRRRHGGEIDRAPCTGNVTTDPTEWNEAGQITTKNRREAIKARFIDPDDPLKLVIVCDMWDVVQSARGNVKVDWTRSHRRDVHAAVESAVKMVLCRRNIRGEQFRFLLHFLLHRLMKQAQASYEEWPLAA